MLMRGHGSTWPGHIALGLDKNFIKDLLRQNKHLKIILIAGTNGKTTTGKLIQTILETDGKRVFQNESGANLLNGIASTLLLHSQNSGKIDYDFGVFEIDENSLPLVVQELTPDFILILNLFRDQLDRYGEVNSIAHKWEKALNGMNSETTLILNADDPQIANLGALISPRPLGERARVRGENVFYFGLDEKSSNKSLDHASDSTYCPNCGTKLEYKTVYFSHLGDWTCRGCKRKRPVLDQSNAQRYPLAGMYNKYNTHAAVLVSNQIGISKETIEKALKNFSPAFGRQEKIEIDGKHVQLFLSKNPTSFNQSLQTIMELKPKHLLFVLNDRIPDGRDVSWIWDTDIEKYKLENIHVYASGDRAYDMALRLKYAHPAVKHVDTFPDLENSLPELVKKLSSDEALYVLPTYSAMLETRQILTGKKIL